MRQSGLISSHIVKNININKTQYAVEDGALYFTGSLEELISEQYTRLDADLQQASDTIYFNINILFDRIIEDANTSTNASINTYFVIYKLTH